MKQSLQVYIELEVIKGKPSIDCERKSPEQLVSKEPFGEPFPVLVNQELARNDPSSDVKNGEQRGYPHFVQISLRMQVSIVSDEQGHDHDLENSLQILQCQLNLEEVRINREFRKTQRSDLIEP